jgi:hypothetical protein
METNKFYDDNSFSNKDFSAIGGIPSDELLMLEIVFMQMIEYQMHISEERYMSYSDKLKAFWKANQIHKK